MRAVANGIPAPSAAIGAYRYVSVADLPTPWTAPSFSVAAAHDPLLDVAETDSGVTELESVGVQCDHLSVESGGHGSRVGLRAPTEGRVAQAVEFWEERREGHPVRFVARRRSGSMAAHSIGPLSAPA